MHVYDIAVVGAGPAGMMAAIRAGCLKKKVLLIERGNSLGKKILLSGKGRANVSNSVSLSEFLSKFGKQGPFLRNAFSRFFNDELINFFKAKGLELKIERQGRVFPVTDRAASILEVLKEYLLEAKVTIVYNKRLINMRKENNDFCLFFETNAPLKAQRVILATGGVTFSFTGSSGDGFAIAKKLGHTVIPLTPGLVPLRTKERWVNQLKGLTLKNISLTFKSKNKKIISHVGELLFTHFGVSGPLVLDVSSAIVGLLEENKEVFLFIDLKPGLTEAELEERLLREFRLQGDKNIKNILKGLLPQRLITVFLQLLKMDGMKKGNQINKEERRNSIKLFKAFPLQIIGSLPIEEAMVSCGGVATKEINPQTMESKIVPGLYFAGEIIDASASSGGYNLQQAFSTGYVAGECAGYSL